MFKAKKHKMRLIQRCYIIGGNSMIEVRNLTKTFKVYKRNSGVKEALKSMVNRKYEVVEALKDVSFSIDHGEMIGYIGPNGAGKSTTIKIMSGILNPDSGSCIVDGLVPWKDRVNHVKNIGVVFGQRSQLWWDVPVVDSFQLIKDIYELPESKFKSNLSELTKMLDIEDIIRMPARQLSLGQRMRCEITSSLLHNPKILFLDEPTIGLDAVSKIAVREFIKKINKERGTTIILTTHDTKDIEALTERIILIGKGRVLLDGKLDTLKQKYGNIRTIFIEYDGVLKDLCEGLLILEDKSGRASIKVDMNVMTIPEAITYLSYKVNIRDIEVSSADMDDIVVAMYKEYSI